MLKNAATYEIMTPESVGLHRSTLVMGKHSGRHAFKEKLRELGFALGDNAVEDAFRRFKDLAARKRDVFDEDIVALVDDTVGSANDRIKFVSLQVVAGSKGPQLADLELEIDGVVKDVQARGNGPVDATFNAIKKLVPHTAKLQLYQVHAVTAGTDAQAEVSVRLEEDGKTVNGQGADADTLVASARAYINALNRLFTKRWPGQTGWAAIPTILPDSGAVTHHPFTPQIAHFIDCVISGKESHCNVADAVKTMRRPIFSRF